MPSAEPLATRLTRQVRCRTLSGATAARGREALATLWETERFDAREKLAGELGRVAYGDLEPDFPQ